MNDFTFPWPIDLTGAAVRIVNGFLYVLYTDKPFYLPGQPVQIMFIKTNISPQPIRLVYPTSQFFDFVVTQNDREIWRWSKDQIFLPVVSVCEYLPGQSQIYHIVWEQSGNNNLDLQPGPGLFNLKAFNTAAELQNESVDLRLRIQQPTQETNNTA